VTLPDLPLPTSTVAVGDAKVEIRGLSRAEALRLPTFEGDLETTENFILACGAEVTEDEARTWRNSVSPDDAGTVIDAICELSGLVEGAQKSG